jgi:aspartokinase
MNSATPTNGLEALQSADVYVTKIGGENAGRLALNATNAQERIRSGIKQVTAVSAIRSSESDFSAFADESVVDKNADGKIKPGFNTTSHLIEIARILSAKKGERNIENAVEIANRIAEFTKAIVLREACNDGCMQDREDVADELVALIEKYITDQSQPSSLIHWIQTDAGCSVMQRGADWILHTRNEYVSLTGLGENLAKHIYETYFRKRGIAVEHLGIDQAFYGVYPKMHRLENPGRIVQGFQDFASDRIRAVLETNDVAIAGGYVPILGSERGYSDKTGALLARATKDVNERSLYLIEKEYPIMSADPRKVPGAKTVQRMTHFLARELFGNSRGARGSAVHPEALEMLASDDISIVVMNPEQDPTADNTTLIQDFEPQPNGVEIIASKSVPFALQISSSNIIGDPLFESNMVGWFESRGLQIQHTATSEGTVSYTFFEGECSDHLLNELLSHLEEEYDISDEKTLSKLEDLSVIYCLGNNMRQYGQASRAAEALDLAKVDIHFISQGLNESVMTFLVDAKDSERAVQMLHDIFISIDESEYRRIKDQFRMNMLQAIQSISSPTS